MSRDYVNIKRTNSPEPIRMTNESFHREFYFDIDSYTPFCKLKAPITLMVGCLYDFTHNLNEDDCSCEGDTYTYFVIKAEPGNVYYIAEYCNNKIFRPSSDRGYTLHTKCHAKDILGLDLNTVEYRPEREPKIVELPSINIGDTIYVKDSYGYAECTVSGLVYTEKGWRINVNHYALWDSPFVNEEGKTWVRARVEAIEKFTSDTNSVFSKGEKEKLEDMIDDAINDEFGFNTDNITNEAWDFLENKAPQIVFNNIAEDLNAGKIETFDEITTEIVDEYLQNAILDFGNIRDYSGD